MFSAEVNQRIAGRWQTVKQEVAGAAIAAGRDPNSVCIVAVTKYVDANSISALVAAGCEDVGESRPQQLWDRVNELERLGGHARWHLIGHLQTNKVAKTIPFVSLIHSVDSLRLLTAIEAAANDQSRTVDVLLEIKVSGDETKHGLQPIEFEHIVEQINAFKHTKVRGLMTMASLNGGNDQARRDFEQLRELRDRWQSQWPALDLGELSMGMSDDFPQAIAAGATLVRVGSRLWE